MCVRVCACACVCVCVFVMPNFLILLLGSFGRLVCDGISCHYNSNYTRAKLLILNKHKHKQKQVYLESA